MATTQRQISWARDELILACDLVAQNGWRQLRATDPEVLELSRLLQEPWLHPVVGRPARFRSAGSVQRKTADIATHHPAYRGAPTKGGGLDEIVLRDFIDDPPGMHRVALKIRELVAEGWTAAGIEDSNDDLEGKEGRLLRTAVQRRERDPKLRADKIESVLMAGHPIACEVCGFDFSKRYPKRGNGYIEVHHRRPLHTTGIVTTRLSDLALLCANCHRMIHRGNWIAVEELILIVRGDASHASGAGS